MTQHPSTSIAMFEHLTTEQLHAQIHRLEAIGEWSQEISDEITRRERDVSPHVTTITLVVAKITYRINDAPRSSSTSVTHYTKRDVLAVLAESERWDADLIERITFTEMKVNELHAHLYVSR